MNQPHKWLLLAGGIAISFFAQQPPRANFKPPALRAQSASTVSLTSKGDEQTLEITNVAYEVSSRLLLRKTTSSTQVLGDKGQEAATTFEAWPLGVDLQQKPLYAVKVTGTGGETVDGALIVAARGLEEVEWWSVYRLGTGQHLFDTYVPLVGFSISATEVDSRYIGLEVPPDDVADVRLKRAEVVGVVTYSSEEQVRSEALLTCDNPDQAAELRSYVDTTRKMSVSDEAPPRALRINFRANAPSTIAPLNVSIPLVNDGLDITHAQLPAHLHLTAWKR